MALLSCHLPLWQQGGVHGSRFALGLPFPATAPDILVLSHGLPWVPCTSLNQPSGQGNDTHHWPVLCPRPIPEARSGGLSLTWNH